ncbi:putative zinc alcohol dehydrogenase [Ophiobolus disseminans]|uniref:Putative zinc alcohol dehydrogenase n=1 Tax=Ophiobolus disseminans TaxID=1469910 RepID=A0A6A6ZK11_9PLEO|nr:putative zinc alcohol dehydrogenase [Ophiobolus disseminans]
MATMKGWLFQASSGPFVKNLSIPTAGIPVPPIKDTEILVRNLSTTLNPIDYKLAELGFISKLIFRSPITPGLDICGTVVQVGSKVTNYKINDKVYGSLGPVAKHGSLAQFVPIAENAVALAPEGLKSDDVVATGCVAATSYAALKPYVKPGDKVFINGGSGGTGVMAIQIAKNLGADVTTSCSSANVELCKSLGADTVLDYKKGDIVAQLKDQGAVFDHVVDNIGVPANLYHASSAFLQPQGKFIQVGLGMNFAGTRQAVGNKLASLWAWGKREWIFVAPPSELHTTYVQLAEWMQQGKLRAVVDSTFEFEELPRAYERLKTGRAKGKVVVHIQE